METQSASAYALSRPSASVYPDDETNQSIFDPLTSITRSGLANRCVPVMHPSQGEASDFAISAKTLVQTLLQTWIRILDLSDLD